ncbi:hypothetical protein GCM10022245_24030 [Streptomyces mayteni]
MGESPFPPLALPRRPVQPDRLRGRDRVLAAVTGAIGQRVRGDDNVPGVWVLSGLGGCGKTTVALEVAHRLSAAMRHVWWVSAGDRHGLSAALQAVAYQAGAQEGEFGRGHPADVLWRHLDDLVDPWLLVLDNVDDPAVLRTPDRHLAQAVGWLRHPGPSRGTILITSRESRQEQWAPWAHIEAMDVLDVDDAARVLLDLAPKAGDERAAGELARHLGGLPLALELAGWYLARAAEEVWPSPDTPGTFAAYRDSVDQRLHELAADRDSLLGNDERRRRAIPTTWQLSLDLLKRQGHDAAQTLLWLLSSLGQAPIPLSLLDPDVLLASGLFEAGTSRSQLGDALGGLFGLRLIKLETMPIDGSESDGSGADDTELRRSIDVHPLVRASNRAQTGYHHLLPDLLVPLTELVNRAVTPLIAPEDRADWARWRLLAPHCAAPIQALSSGENADVPPEHVIAATQPALRAGQYRHGLGLYAEAEHDLRAVVDVRRNRLGAEHPATLDGRLALAYTLHHAGRLREAEAEYLSVAQCAGMVVPAEHRIIQSARGGRARVLSELGDLATAEAELRDVLAMRRRDPRDHHALLRTRYSMASVLHLRGRLAQAIAELEEIWQEARRRYESAHPQLLSIGTLLVRALRDGGRLDEAEEIGITIVMAYERTGRSEHPDALIARHELARVVRDQGRLEEARDRFAEITEAYLRRLGPGHPGASASRHELATVLHQLGQLDAAADHFRAVLATNREHYDVDHRIMWTIRHNLAIVLRYVRRGGQGWFGRDRDRGDLLTREGDPIVADLLGVADLPLDAALSAELPGGAAAAERLRSRFTRPWLSRGGTTSPAGEYSTGWQSHSGNDDSSSSVRYSARRARYSARPDPTGEYSTGWNASGNGDSSSSVRYSARPDPTTGYSESQDIETLRRQQQGIRRLMLGELLRAAAERPTGPLPPLAAARELLVRADRAAPAAVADVLLYPSTGRWLSRLLSRLHSTNEGSVPLWVDLGHLHAIASAAAIRAKLTFELHAPARDGAVLLPTLGLARLGDVGTVSAHVTTVDGRAVISHGTTRVPLTGPSPDWHPLRQVTASFGARSLTLRLDDLDTFRDTAPPAAPAPLSAEADVRWRRLTEDAWRLLVDLDAAQATDIATALSSLTPQPARPHRGTSSLSSSEAFGGVVLTEPPDATQLAVTLVHEFRHMWLNAILDTTELIEPPVMSPDERFYAPWRNDPRPLEGLFHGVFAFCGVTDFWLRASRAAGDDRARRQARFEFAYWRIQTWDTLAALRTNPRLTAAGRRFLRATAESATVWRDEPVPEDIAGLARDAVFAHRVLWRLVHSHAAPETVGALADNWRVDLPPALGAGSVRPSFGTTPPATNLDSAVAPFRHAAVVRGTSPDPIAVAIRLGAPGDQDTPPAFRA